MIMKIAFVIGHTEKDKGAFSTTLNKSEWDLFKDIKELEEIGDVIVHDKSISSYKARQENTAKHKTKDYDIVFELHFNAANGKAQGCEALYYKGSFESMSIASDFCKIWGEKTGIKIRGAKSLDVGSRGYEFVQSTKGVAVLLEPFFGDNIEDCQKWSSEKFIETLKELLK